MMRRVLMAVIGALVVSVSISRAVMIGHYPGLDKLIDQADAIVILRIEGQKGGPWEPTLLSTADCYIYQSLKGEIPVRERITLRLMDTRSEFVSPFADGSIHLIFLSKVDNEATGYRSIQMQGSNVRLSPFGHEKMPAGDSVKERVATLIKSAAEYRQREHEKEQAFLRGLLEQHGNDVDLSEWEKKK